MALLLASGEALIDAALAELRIDVKIGHCGLDLLDPEPELGRLTADRGDGSTKKVRHRHTGHLDRILHRQEQSRAGPLIDAHLQNVPAIKGDRP